MFKIKKSYIWFIISIFLGYSIIAGYFLHNTQFIIDLEKSNFRILLYILLSWIFSYILFAFRLKLIYSFMKIQLAFKECLIYQFIEHAFFIFPFKFNHLIISLILKNKYHIKFRKTIPIRLLISFVDLLILVLLSIFALFSYFVHYINNYFILAFLIISVMMLSSSSKFIRFITNIIN